MKHRTGVALTMAMLMVGSSSALSQETSQPDELPPFLLEQRMAGAQIRYLGMEYGIHSWLGTKGGQVQFFYTVPNSDAVISGGLLIGPDGELITARLIDGVKNENPELVEEVAKESRSVSSETPSANKNSVSESFYSEVEGAHWVAIGSDQAPTLYVFIDTQCQYCHEYWQDLADPYIDEGKLQVRLIPVAFINEKSLPEAAALLTHTDPETAWRRHVKGDNSALKETEINEIAVEAVKRNSELFSRWKLQSTPYSVYRDHAGNIKVVRGMQPGKADVVYHDLTGKDE